VLSLKVTAREELLAWIVIGLPSSTPLDESTRREVGELRDRIGVTLTAARRERQLIERAATDSLTNLLSRAGLVDAVHTRLEAPGGGPALPHTLLFVDLDRFKDVNDHLGHQAGDELLCVIAARLTACAPAGSLLARPGGDEFVVMAPGTPEQAAAIAARICKRLSEPVALRGQVVAVGASVGLARYPDHGTTLVDLLRRADMAMYHAKASGRGRFQWFEPALDAQHADRVVLLQDLQQALAHGQFELHYQPRVSAQSGQVCSVEALLRWRHPTRGLVAPTQFIALLEESALIESVGQWVLSTACHQLRRLRAGGMVLDCIAINVSPRQILAAGYADRVLDTVADARLAARDIELEVTEGLFVGHGTATPTILQRLRDAGMRIAIDDFGTGFSSLSYLHRLPFDVLKIDRSFVNELGVEADAQSVTRAIVALARTLRKRVVAEGVETQQQARLLRDIGCDEFQGYFFARPMDAPALAAWLSAQQATRVLEAASTA
jgi:diguanylate cyclase